MSYQKKSTPSFQRMLSTSTRYGDLQKLQEEYERVKGFDIQHNIESKMRQVRLKRLFKEIDDIRENEVKKQRVIKRKQRSSHFQQQPQRPTHHTQPTVGPYHNSVHNIYKNRSCPLNNSSKVRSSAYNRIYFDNQIRPSYDDEELSKARLLRRVNYGNQISSWNMQKMLMRSLRKDVKAGIEEIEPIIKPKSKRLSHKSRAKSRKSAVQRQKKVCSNRKQQKYGKVVLMETIEHIKTPLTETTSKTLVPEEANQIVEVQTDLPQQTKSLLSNKTGMHKVPSVLQHSSKSLSSIGSDSLEKMYSCESLGVQLHKSTEVNKLNTNNIDRINNVPQEPQHDMVMEIEHQQPQPYQSDVKLKQQLFDNPVGLKKCSHVSDKLDECHNNSGYQLRTISNATNLPQSQEFVRQDDHLNLTDEENDYSEDDDTRKTEKLLCTNVLLNYLSNHEMQRSKNNYNKRNNDDDKDTEGEGATAVSTNATIHEDVTPKTSYTYQQQKDTIIPSPPPAPPLPTRVQKDFNYKPYILKQKYAQPPSQFQPQQHELQQKHEALLKEFLHKYCVMDHKIVQRQVSDYSKNKLKGIFEHNQ